MSRIVTLEKKKDKSEEVVTESYTSYDTIDEVLTAIGEKKAVEIINVYHVTKAKANLAKKSKGKVDNTTKIFIERREALRKEGEAGKEKWEAALKGLELAGYDITGLGW